MLRQCTAVTGDELDAATVNLGDIHATPRLEDALKGYIGISRVSGHQDLRIAQPFPRTLFQQGRLEIAHCFLEVMEKHSRSLNGLGECMQPAELEGKLDQIEEQKTKRKTHLRYQTFQCLHCKSRRGYAFYLSDTSAKKQEAELHEAIQEEISKKGDNIICRMCLVEDNTRHALVLRLQRDLYARCLAGERRQGYMHAAWAIAYK